MEQAPLGSRFGRDAPTGDRGPRGPAPLRVRPVGGTAGPAGGCAGRGGADPGSGGEATPPRVLNTSELSTGGVACGPRKNVGSIPAGCPGRACAQANPSMQFEAGPPPLTTVQPNEGTLELTRLGAIIRLAQTPIALPRSCPRTKAGHPDSPDARPGLPPNREQVDVHGAERLFVVFSAGLCTT